MYKQLTIRFLLFSFFAFSNFIFLAAQDIAGTWNGTITMEGHFSGITGTSETKIRLTVTENKVTGSVETHGKLIMSGIHYGNSDCTGAGDGELWRVAFNADGTYDIEAMSPVSSCTNVDLQAGTTTTTEGNSIDVTIHNQRIPDDRSVLSGTLVNQGASPDGTGGGTKTVTWHLEKSRDLVLIVAPLDYDTWLPVPGKDEFTKGSVLPIALKLQKADGSSPPIKAKQFVIKLNGTSNEPGITINAPLQPMSGDAASFADIRILPAATGRLVVGSQEMTISCNCTTANVSLAAFDGGGYATLTVEATLEDNSIVKGHLLQPHGETDILVPKRDPGSTIAKAWLDANGHPGDRDDEEQLKGNTNKGDGLSAYEEYRGVISEGVFKRLDPQKLEAGVWMKKTDVPLFIEGIKWLERAAGIKVVRFIDNEIGSERKFNKNNNTANVYLQYVQKLQNSAVGDGIGENVPAELTVKTPRESERVVVDVNKVRQNFLGQQRALQMANARYHLNLTMPYTEIEQRANTVAHELAHGLDVDHHGELSPPLDSETIPAGGLTIYHIYPKHSPEITERPYTIHGNIGTVQNDESGDLSCIMAYTSYYQWIKRVEMNGDINYYEAGLLPYGRKLCETKTDPNSTSLNYGNKFFGEARFGDCMKQVRFK